MIQCDHPGAEFSGTISELDEIQSALRIVPALQMRRRLGDDDLERRPNMRALQMTRDGAAVPLSEHEMNMQRRFIPVIDADIAG